MATVTFLRYLCRVVPGLQGVGVDLSADAVRSGQEQLAGTDLEGRITLIHGDAGDMSAHRVALDGVTAATTFFVLHELADHGQSEKLAGFFSRFSETLPDASLIMVETIRPDTEELRAKPGPALEYFFLPRHLRASTRSRSEWTRSLEIAGFKSVHEHYLSFARSAIYVAARKPEAVTAPVVAPAAAAVVRR